MRITVIYISFLLTTWMTGAAVPGARINAEKTGSKISITIDGKYFTCYVFSDEEKYPYFYPVNGPVSGGSVTSMRNAVYPHHTSLFFGCDMVNGGNYWQEGNERGRIISVNAQIAREGGDTAIITDECIWSRPGAESPVKDSRKYIITSPSESVRQIDVEITLEMLTDVTIKKTNHSLFSARMAADLAVTSGGTIINAEGASGEIGTFGKPSAWIDFHGRRGNAVEGLAIMQHPSNPWYPSPWFTRDYGFISPTPMYWPDNGNETFLQKGTRLLLRYRVIVHSGTHTDAGIGEIFRRYKTGK